MTKTSDLLRFLGNASSPVETNLASLKRVIEAAVTAKPGSSVTDIFTAIKNNPTLEASLAASFKVVLEKTIKDGEDAVLARGRFIGAVLETLPANLRNSSEKVTAAYREANKLTDSLAEKLSKPAATRDFPVVTDVLQPSAGRTPGTIDMGVAQRVDTPAPPTTGRPTVRTNTGSTAAPSSPPATPPPAVPTQAPPPVAVVAQATPPRVSRDVLNYLDENRDLLGTGTPEKTAEFFKNLRTKISSDDGKGLLVDRPPQQRGLALQPEEVLEEIRQGRPVTRDEFNLAEDHYKKVAGDRVQKAERDAAQAQELEDAQPSSAHPEVSLGLWKKYGDHVNKTEKDAKLFFKTDEQIAEWRFVRDRAVAPDLFKSLKEVHGMLIRAAQGQGKVPMSGTVDQPGAFDILRGILNDPAMPLVRELAAEGNDTVLMAKATKGLRERMGVPYAHLEVTPIDTLNRIARLETITETDMTALQVAFRHFDASNTSRTVDTTPVNPNLYGQQGGRGLTGSLLNQGMAALRTAMTDDPTVIRWGVRRELETGVRPGGISRFTHERPLLAVPSLSAATIAGGLFLSGASTFVYSLASPTDAGQFRTAAFSVFYLSGDNDFFGGGEKVKTKFEEDISRFQFNQLKTGAGLSSDFVKRTQQYTGVSFTEDEISGKSPIDPKKWYEIAQKFIQISPNLNPNDAYPYAIVLGDRIGVKEDKAGESYDGWLLKLREGAENYQRSSVFAQLSSGSALSNKAFTDSVKLYSGVDLTEKDQKTGKPLFDNVSPELLYRISNAMKARGIPTGGNPFDRDGLIDTLAKLSNGLDTKSADGKSEQDKLAAVIAFNEKASTASYYGILVGAEANNPIFIETTKRLTRTPENPNGIDLSAYAGKPIPAIEWLKIALDAQRASTGTNPREQNAFAAALLKRIDSGFEPDFLSNTPRKQEEDGTVKDYREMAVNQAFQFFVRNLRATPTGTEDYVKQVLGVRSLPSTPSEVTLLVLKKLENRNFALSPDGTALSLLYMNERPSQSGKDEDWTAKVLKKQGEVKDNAKIAAERALAEGSLQSAVGEAGQTSADAAAASRRENESLRRIQQAGEQMTRKVDESEFRGKFNNLSKYYPVFANQEAQNNLVSIFKRSNSAEAMEQEIVRQFPTAGREAAQAAREYAFAPAR